MKLHYAKLSTYCQKVMIAFAEKEVSFTPSPVNMMDPASKEKYAKLYPLGRIPLLELKDGTLIPESTIIVEYLDEKYTTGTKLIPTDKEQARRVRLHDRMCDWYLNEQVSTIFFDSISPPDKRDPEAVADAKTTLEEYYKMLDKDLAKSTWLAGSQFTMADCSAYAPLFYAKEAAPFSKHKNIVSYFGRLIERKTVTGVMNEVLPELKKFQESRR